MVNVRLFVFAAGPNIHTEYCGPRTRITIVLSWWFVIPDWGHEGRYLWIRARCDCDWNTERGASSEHPVLLMWSWTWCLKRPGPASDPLTIDVAETNDTSRGLALPLMLDVARTLMPQEGSVVTVFSDDWSLVLPWPVTRSSKDCVYICSCSNSFKRKGWEHCMSQCMTYDHV